MTGFSIDTKRAVSSSLRAAAAACSAWERLGRRCRGRCWSFRSSTCWRSREAGTASIRPSAARPLDQGIDSGRISFLRALWRRAGAEHSSTKTGTVLHGFPVNRGAAPRPRGTDLPRDWPDIRVHAGGAGAWRQVGHSEQPCHWRQNRGGAGHIEVKFAAEALIVGRG